MNRANTAPTILQTDPFTLYTYQDDGRPWKKQQKGPDGVFHTWEYAWNSEGRLTRVVKDEVEVYSATYDASGLRTSKTTNGGSHTYLWGLGGIIQDVGPDGATTYTPGLSQRDPDGSDLFFHGDWMGNTRHLTDEDGEVSNSFRYDAFGNRVAGAGHPTDFLFAGAWGYQDEEGLGLQYLQQRYYDPSIGRFLSPDPIGLAGGMNLYGYCGGDPVGGVDPSGLGPPAELDEALGQAVHMGMVVQGATAGGIEPNQPVGCYTYEQMTGGSGGGALTQIPLREGRSGRPGGGGGGGGGGASTRGTRGQPSTGQRPAGLLLSAEKIAASAVQEVSEITRFVFTGRRGNGGRGGDPQHAETVEVILAGAGGKTEQPVPGSGRAADIVDRLNRIHQVGDMRTRSGPRPSSRERAAIEDIAKAAPGIDIFFHDKNGIGPTLINPHLQPGWKPAPTNQRKNP